MSNFVELRRKSRVTFRAFWRTYIATIINAIAPSLMVQWGLAASYQTRWSRDALISTGTELLGALFASRDVLPTLTHQLEDSLTHADGRCYRIWLTSYTESHLSHLHADFFFFQLYIYVYPTENPTNKSKPSRPVKGMNVLTFFSFGVISTTSRKSRNASVA
jgi:hypothetical protein